MTEQTISVIFFPGEEQRADKKTLGQLRRAFGAKRLQIIMADPETDRPQAYNQALEQVTGQWVTVADGGDRIPASWGKRMLRQTGARDDEATVWMARRRFGPFSLMRSSIFEGGRQPETVLSLDHYCHIFPVFLNGVLIRADVAANFPMDPAMGLDAEQEMLLRLLLKERRVGYLPDKTYTYVRPQGIHFDLTPDMYDPDWYRPSLQRFLLPLLERVRREEGHIPLFVQCFCMYYIRCRLEANSNNRDKHLLDEEQVDGYLEDLRQALSYLDDEAILNLPEAGICQAPPNIHLMLLQIKHGEWDRMYKPYPYRTLLFGTDDAVAYSKDKMRVRIEFIDYRDGKWEIDGSVPAFFSLQDVRLFVRRDDEEFDLTFNQRYSLTKFFGRSAFKRYTFHVSVPLQADKRIQRIQFQLQVGCMTYSLSPEYASHFSRLSGKMKYQYWMFDRYCAYHAGNHIVIRRAGGRYRAYRELRLWWELLWARPAGVTNMVLGLRMLYFLTRPWYKRRRIWLFYDKIYKGGDSSEYLYHYARRQKDGIHCYYLLDRHCPDWKRARREGFRPVRRGSARHRMLFLNADMVIASNSTVFPFNGYSMELSAYIRGLPDFHVVCVQHGMSVQKIAIAQNRLRDNTRLYFCASRYEIENLSHPVYDYVGYDALKLTGVPRYDGLIDEDQKQILISPTWRMQAARLVNKSESVQRDYNPLFKESPYYKVYNSLINDPRLIEAARQYGYKIVYVLHPIISPQAADFDVNDYVQLIPSTGEMSYEKIFRESSLMVTDFSGVQFDFAYMRKPLLYLHHDDIPQHYEEGTFHYDTMAFGEICHNNDELIDQLIAYMRDGCQMKPEYRRRADDFFAFNDHNNCQRIYDVMLDYQKTRIDPVHHGKP